MKKSSGVLMHISSLPGKYSCGNIRGGYGFVDFLSACGFSYWQILPLFIPDNAGSPYSSCSSYLGNPFFIDIDRLFEDGLITNDELDSQIDENPYKVDFDFLYSSRIKLLYSAAKKFNGKKETEIFYLKNKDILKAVEFYTLYLQNEKKDFRFWKTKELDNELFEAWKFIEYRFYSDWNMLHEYANKKGVKIIGDLPFYLSGVSGDLYCNKSEFAVDDDYIPKAVAGVPPDRFAKNGQLWGNPLYDFENMKKNNYGYFTNKIKHMFNMFDGLRLDHFRGFSEYYAIKQGSENAKNGTWIKGPGKDITDIINGIKGDRLIIAEDLGTIDYKVKKLVAESGFLSTSVFEFGFDGNYNNPHLPHNYTNKTAAYTSTHDNNTLLGFLWEEDEQTRNAVFDYIGTCDNIDIAVKEIIRTMFKSAASLVIFPIQDILGYGGDTRMNVPGTARGNWTFRVTNEQLKSIDKNFYLHLNTIYSRK